ncbi:MAG: S1 RNA-binding domain-containing protein, partial [Longimicrobiales bacterium]
DGLIHISDMSWTRRVQHPSEVVRKADDLEVVVLGVDPENKRISLGLKQTTDDPWESITQQFTPGTEAVGRVVRLVEDGVVVDLGNEIEGFVPRSHVPIQKGDLADHLRSGQQMDLRVQESDATNRRIVLTVTHIHEPPPEAEPVKVEVPVPAPDEIPAAALQEAVEG